MQASVESVALGRPLGLKPPRAAAGARTSRLAHAASLGAILLFVVLITLPFSGQALHIDDAIFWDFARANLESPLSIDLPDYRLMGDEIASFRDTHPPLVSLYMAAIMNLAGSESVAALHIGFMLFPAIAGISMFYLGRRFTRNALLAALLLLATPAFMVMSHNFMGDVPMMALWLAATAAYVYGVDRDSAGLLASSGLLAALAVFTGYQALALILLLPLYALLSGRLSIKTALPVLLPALAFAWFAFYNLSYFGALPRFTHARGLSMDGDHLTGRVLGIMLQMGGASVFPLFMAGLFSLRRKRFLLLPLIAEAAAILGLHQYNPDGYPRATLILFILFMTAALAAVTAIVVEGAIQVVRAVSHRQVDTDFAYLALWLLAMMAGVIVLLPHATAKYLLPFLAPLILLLLKDTEAVVRSKKAVSGILIAATVMTFVTGMAVSAADSQWAQSYRHYAEGVGERLQPKETVWFVGEWGFRHYMEAQGYRYLASSNSSPAEGDIIVRSGFTDWPLSPAVVDRMYLVENTEAQWTMPLRVMSFDANAGFYGSHWGLLPFAVTDAPLERFEVFQIGPNRNT